jgi:outer membrane protein, multidrug efflux system
MKLLRLCATLGGCVCLLAACAVARPPSSPATTAPPQWYAPLPHGGQLADLRQWWEQLGDPLLADLVAAAQSASPDVATAGRRIAEARADRVTARAAMLPSLDANVSVLRGNSLTGSPAGGSPVGGSPLGGSPLGGSPLGGSQAAPGLPASTVVQGTLQTSWEADLFGGLVSHLDAASQRLAGAEAGWHEARVAVAAQTATAYVDLRTCQLQLEVARNDAASRAETARLSGLSANAGFTAPAEAAQARASAAEGAVRVTQQQAQCDLDVKALVALTAMAEPQLRERLGTPWREPGDIRAFAVPPLPAELLAQRPDVYQAERQVAAASADVGAARADRYPRLSLTGQLNAGAIHVSGVSADFQTWSIGPVTLSLPIFDAGRRAAAEDAAVARYDEAAALYTARVRQAVREVEEALVNLQGAIARTQDTAAAYAGYRTSFLAAESRYRSGLGSLIEMEDQRRLALGAELSLVNVQRDRYAAWIALYRALGGGWAHPETLASP